MSSFGVDQREEWDDDGHEPYVPEYPTEPRRKMPGFRHMPTCHCRECALDRARRLAALEASIREAS